MAQLSWTPCLYKPTLHIGLLVVCSSKCQQKFDPQPGPQLFHSEHNQITILQQTQCIAYTLSTIIMINRFLPA